MAVFDMIENILKSIELCQWLSACQNDVIKWKNPVQQIE
jgi:hypothetical protein